MDKNKKTRLFVRILCGILAVIMTLSVIVPIAYATEVEDSPYVGGDGFEYVYTDGDWYLNVTGEYPVVRLTNVPDAYIRDNMPVLIANIDTFEVYVVNLLDVRGYVDVLPIKEGYYLVYTNNYTWADKNGDKWAINNTDTIYFYYGDPANMDAHKYDLDFIAEDNIIELPMTLANDSGLYTVPANGVFHFDAMDSAYPLYEIYNYDEIIARMEHIDLAQSLEAGYTIYVDGYTPNTSENYSPSNNANITVPGQITVPGGQNNAPTVDYLSSSNGTTAPGDNSDLPDIPIAVPEIQETTPLPEVEIVDKNNPPTSETKPAIDPIELVADKVGLDIQPVSFKAALLGILDGLWIYVLLLAICGAAYYKLKKKDYVISEERTENDFYDDTRIE